MKLIHIFVIFTFSLHSGLSGADFITKLEYAKMLYQNPRGIGCNKCHGQKAEGAVIAKYKNYDKKTKTYVEKSLVAPKLWNVEFSVFKQSLRHPKSIMPTYFLTDDEIQNLYEFIQTLNKGQK